MPEKPTIAELGVYGMKEFVRLTSNLPSETKAALEKFDSSQAQRHAEGYEQISQQPKKYGGNPLPGQDGWEKHFHEI